jgi:hypothetical protein
VRTGYLKLVEPPARLRIRRAYGTGQAPLLILGEAWPGDVTAQARNEPEPSLA